MNDKRLALPVIIAILAALAMLARCNTGGGTVEVSVSSAAPDGGAKPKFDLMVYVENSGSMDGYMCAGSQLKDAVYDYISDLQPLARSCRLAYINSQVILSAQPLAGYIKNLTPASFAAAGGNRESTDMASVFSRILGAREARTVSVLVSDCALSVGGNPQAYLGQCQVAVKQAAAAALAKWPDMGVEVMRMESDFAGTWYPGAGKMRLSGVKLPYYIWVIGPKDALSYINGRVPPERILGSVAGRCAFSPVGPLPAALAKSRYAVNHTDRIAVEMLVSLSGTLQAADCCEDVSNYTLSAPQRAKVEAVRPVTAARSPYTHVITLGVSSPRDVKSLRLTLVPPAMPAWATASGGSTGLPVKADIGKTAGLKNLLQGFADAYRDHRAWELPELKFKNI